MVRLLFGFILVLEIFALANRGGGPLLSYLFLTGITFLSVLVCILFRAEIRARFGPAALFYVLFFLAFILSLVISLTPGYGLAEILLFGNLGILFFIFSGLKLGERDLHWFSIGLIGLAVIDTLIGYFIYTQTPFPRFTGTFISLQEPYVSFGNDFANFLLLILPLSIWQFFRKHRRPTTTWVFGLTTAILLSGFVLSFSRGAWISFDTVFIIAVIWFFLRRKKTKFSLPAKHMALRALSVIVITVLLINGLQFVRGKKFQVTPLFKKITLQADEGNASASERIQFWKGAVKLIAEQPLFGTGVLSFKYLYPKYQPTFGANWDHPHNIFLRFGVESGIFTMIFFALFLVAVAVTMLRFLWKTPWHPCVWFLFGALGAFGHNLVDLNFVVSNFTLFIIFIALSISFTSPSILNTPSSILNTPSSILFFRPLFLITLLLLLLGLHEGLYNIDFKRGRAALAFGNLDTAVTLLENSKELFFERDLTNYLSLAYRKKFEETGDPIWRAREADLLSETAFNTVDAALPFRLGELAFEQKSFEKAEELFSRAVQMDPKNRLRYYYELVRVKQTRNVPTDAALQEKIRNLLQEYTPALRYNQHFTVLTDNPNFASKLYEFFGMKKEQAEFDSMWFQELLKFSATYGAIKKPLLQSS